MGEKVANTACKWKMGVGEGLLKKKKRLLCLSVPNNDENKPTNQTDAFSPKHIGKLAFTELYSVLQCLRHLCNTSSEQKKYALVEKM